MSGEGRVGKGRKGWIGRKKGAGARKKDLDFTPSRWCLGIVVIGNSEINNL